MRGRERTSWSNGSNGERPITMAVDRRARRGLNRETGHLDAVRRRVRSRPNRHAKTGWQRQQPSPGVRGQRDRLAELLSRHGGREMKVPPQLVVAAPMEPIDNFERRSEEHTSELQSRFD